MKPYEEWLQEFVVINNSYPITRKEYYETYIKNANPKDFYLQLLNINKPIGIWRKIWKKLW